MDKRTWCVAVAMIGCVSALGCSKKTNASAPDAGNAGTGGTSAAAGTGAVAGATAGTAAGTGGRAPVTTHNIPCGDTMCAEADPNAPQAGGIGFMPAQVCCATDSKGAQVCGSISMTTTMCEAPPDPAPKCPKLFGMPGCCVNNDLCGADLSLVGRGCAELGAFSMMVPAMFRNFLMIPPATHCDGTLVPVPDAGMAHEDAGM